MNSRTVLIVDDDPIILGQLSKEVQRTWAIVKRGTTQFF